MAIKIALAGNPNCGKTTLFNNLTGSSQYVGNWPGVTVEKKEGRLKGTKDVIIQDLPGIYSLSPYTLEEVITRNYLMRDKPDVIMNLVDATNIERNLYLTTQLMELGIPTIISLNMIDVIEKRGDQIDIPRLERALGLKIIKTSALKGTGSKELAESAIALAASGQKPSARITYSTMVEDALREIQRMLPSDIAPDAQRWYATKLFERDQKVLEQIALKPAQRAQLESLIARCEDALGDDSESIIINERYEYITELVRQCVVKKSTALTTSDKIDRVFTNRWLALPIFAAVMFLVYYISISTVGTLMSDWVNDELFGTIIPPALTGFLESIEAAPWLTSLIVDGIVAGMGAVLGFLPQMATLFLLLGILEDCGYISRIAFIMDRIFRRFGLSGRSFIPLLVSTGCGVPGIMASRTIESESDRRMTVMTATFIPCSAKLPVIALIAGALFAGSWWVAPSAYFLGIAAIVLTGIALKKTKLFAGDPSPFVMELPAYHLPSPKSVLIQTWDRVWSFVKKAGTIIFISCMAVWFFSNFAWNFTMVEDTNASILASLGRAIAWLFTPLGWGNWQAAVATITGLIAKENVVSTFGILYGFAEVAEDGAEIWGTLQAAFTGLAAYSFLMFNLLCAPCMAAVGAIRREMNSAKWTFIAIGYQTGLAYCVALVFYQFGMLLTGHPLTVWSAVALVIAALMLYMLFRADPNKTRVLPKEASA